MVVLLGLRTVPGEEVEYRDLTVTVDKADGHVWTDADWDAFADSGERPL